MMTYKEALEFISEAARFGDKPGLERVAALLEKFGDPHKELKCIHIAGTNGKGSACAMTESVLRAAGYKVGLFVSPYLEDYRERIQINREPIPEDDLAALMTVAAAYCDQMDEQARKFEIETAIALKYFAEKKCDAVVLEVGLGGRLDATNVIPPPEAAIITSISFDHTNILGNKLDEIAFEKCGIIKKGSAVITCVQHPTVAAVIERHSREKGAALAVAVEVALSVKHISIDGSEFTYNGITYRLPLIGAHQIQNALVVIEAVAALRKRGWKIPRDAEVKGLRSVQWAGRFEAVQANPLCIIDAAHNLAAVSMLCGTIDALLAEKRLITVMAMGEDKRYDICSPMMAKRSDCFIATEFPFMRPVSAENLAKASRRCPEETPEPLVIPDPEEAVRKALELAGPDDVVLACGSLYMIGIAKKAMLG